MKKVTLLHTPTRIADLRLDDLAEIDNGNWQLRAERIQHRRTRLLRLTGA